MIYPAHINLLTHHRGKLRKVFRQGQLDITRKDIALKVIVNKIV